MGIDWHQTNLLGLKAKRDYNCWTAMPLIAWRNCDECLVSWKGGQEIQKTGENEVTSNTGFRAVTGVNEMGRGSRNLPSTEQQSGQCEWEGLRIKTPFVLSAQMRLERLMFRQSWLPGKSTSGASQQDPHEHEPTRKLPGSPKTNLKSLN